MPVSLFDRLTGALQETDGSKIPLHQFRAALSEIERGALTADDVAAEFGLDASQKTDMLNLLGKVATLTTSEQRIRFVLWMFDWFALAERSNFASRYLDEATFWSEVNALSWMT